jgi:hypothetical protein
MKLRIIHKTNIFIKRVSLKHAGNRLHSSNLTEADFWQTYQLLCQFFNLTDHGQTDNEMGSVTLKG